MERRKTEDKIEPDKAAAKSFLQQFATPWFIQTIDDDKQRGSHKLSHSFRGIKDLDACWDELAALNKAGAGIYFCVNEVAENKDRKKENIKAVRAHFVDLDNAPLAPVFQFEILPDLVVRTSFNKYHAYWLLRTPIAPDAFVFRKVQKTLAEKFNGDQQVNDLPRIMRVAGFYNMKSKPFMTVWKFLTEDIKQQIKDGKIDLSQLFGDACP